MLVFAAGSLGWRVLVARTADLQVALPLLVKALESPADQARLRLLHGRRLRRPTQGACSSLPLTLWVEIACRQDHAPAGGFAFASEAAMKLRLIEQACRCSTMRGAGRLKVRARLCSLHSRVESACHQNHAPAGGFAFASDAAMKKLRLMEQACGCSTVRGGGRLKVRARLCRWHSRVESACRQDHAPASGLPL